MPIKPLPMAIKQFVVMCLACFDTPTETQQKVRQEFNVATSRQAIQKYDPTKAAGEKLGGELRTLFFATRERFIDQLEALPLAHRTARLRKLESVYDEARDKGDRKSALAALALAAKEMQPFTYADDGDNPEGEQP